MPILAVLYGWFLTPYFQVFLDINQNRSNLPNTPTGTALRLPGVTKTSGFYNTKNTGNKMDTKEDIKTSLGPLEILIGTWVGDNGINIIAVPDESGPSGFRLVENRINESITFQPIGGKVPNQAFKTKQEITGLFYEWRVADAANNNPLHFENGMILVLDMQEVERDGKTVKIPKTVVRQISVPHGNTVLSVGNLSNPNDTKGAPSFGDTSSIPAMDASPIGNPVGDPKTDPAAREYLAQYAALKAKLEAQKVDLGNLNSLLENQIKAQQADFEVGEDLVLSEMTTVAGGGGIHNIDFIKQHADTTKMVSTFWIETLTNKATGAKKHLLQYNQDITIEFFPNKDGSVAEQTVKWPHIDVNTLTKQ